MPIKECCSADVVCCDADTIVSDVAALMRKHHVGNVVVIEDKGTQRVPIGILTDRDIVMETVALDLDPDVFTAGDLMTAPINAVREDEGFVDTLRLMRKQNVRRVPVVANDGTLVGIVTTDDIVRMLAMELSMVTETMTEQRNREKSLRK